MIVASMMDGGITRMMIMNSLIKKLWIATTIVYMAQSVASPLSQEEIRNKDKAYLQKIGINLLDGEVKIISSKTLKAQVKDDFYLSRINKYLAMYKEQEKKGYVSESEPRAKELLDFKNSASFQFKKYVNEFSPISTHLRSSMSDLKMAYTFVGVPNTEVSENIGFAPYGAYKQTKYGDASNGWDGAIQFFVKDKIGTCEFKEHNLKLAHGGVELIQELISDDIGGKPTVILTKGTNETGFLYQVSWYDNTFSRELSCASEKFNITTKDAVLELAKAIEQAQ